jgi:hypothetical protein
MVPLRLQAPDETYVDSSSKYHHDRSLLQSVSLLVRKSAATLLLDRILGPPSNCKFCDTAPVTAMEARYAVHPKIAEFSCCVTHFLRQRRTSVCSSAVRLGRSVDATEPPSRLHSHMHPFWHHHRCCIIHLPRDAMGRPGRDRLLHGY